MLNRFFTLLCILCVFSFTAVAKNNDNPFAKNSSLDIGKDVSWIVDNDVGLAQKSAAGSDGIYYHLKFNNKQLELVMSSDASGVVAKSFSRLEIKSFNIDGKQSTLFSWCLNNQDGHNKFLQQGLVVKKNVCEVDGGTGRFIIRLNRETLTALQNGRSLSITIKQFRTPIEINYDLSDFQEMYVALNYRNAQNVESATAVAVPAVSAVSNSGLNKCWARAPERFNRIRAIEYFCADTLAKLNAETMIAEQVSQQAINQRVLAAQRVAEKEKRLKQADVKKQNERAAKLKQEELLQAEVAAAAAVIAAASEAKQVVIGDEISQKMISMCDKYWSKGEHRCYCQKYIEHAPDSIQNNSKCE